MASPSVVSRFRMRQLPWTLLLAWAGASTAQTQPVVVAAANLREVIVSGTQPGRNLRVSLVADF